MARAHNLKILPVLIDKFSSTDSPLKEIVDAGHKFKYAIRGIEDLHTLDFSGNYPIWGRGSYEKNFEELANVIQPIRKPFPLNSEPVYISYYLRTDREFSERLTRDLELARASTWLDSINIKVGDNWREAMYSGLRQAKHFIVCLSPDSTTSENIKHEVLLAKIRKLPIYPVVSEKIYEDKEQMTLLEKTLDESDEMRFLNDYQWFLPDPDYRSILENLKQSLGLGNTQNSPKNGIFLSYHRADTQAATGRIREKLVEHFGAETVFMDVDSIPPGEDFSRYYKDWLVNRAAVVLVMIGEEWTSLKSDPQSDSLPRLFYENDHVRIEAETALGIADLRVIPVLVGNAKSPKPQDLPESLHPLTRLNVSRVRYDPDFTNDIKSLITSIESL